MEIVWLGDPACHERDLVGGKAAHLSRLAATHLVPPGFCLTARFAFDQLAHGAAPYQQMEDAYRQLAARCGIESPPVAVRSSAIDEDGSVASFAGQHETYLNRVGPAAVADAAMRCWQSVRSERALAYRRAMVLDQAESRLAVLVQQLVPADCAIVAFSGNPVTGSREELVIEANWGLGESIVSGAASPDTYILAKAGLTLRDRSIGDKRRMTVPVAGGTQDVETPRELRGRATLDGAQLAEVARLVLGLEAWMGRPVDVEAAYAGGRLYLLQCRAATTFAGSV
jgi:phosphoenolpyruvate synthase/pyruvate phosphate dikinase